MSHFEETIEILYKFRYQSHNIAVIDALQQMINIINNNSELQKEYTIELMLIIQDIVKNSTENEISKVTINDTPNFLYCKTILMFLQVTINICKNIVSTLTHFGEKKSDVFQLPVKKADSVYYRLREIINSCIQLYTEKWELEKIANYPGLTGNSIVQIKIIKALPNFQNNLLQNIEQNWKSLQESICSFRFDSDEIEKQLETLLATFKDSEKKLKETINQLNIQIQAIINIKENQTAEKFQSFFVNNKFRVIGTW